jgi:hypothetical protein
MFYANTCKYRSIIYCKTCSVDIICFNFLTTCFAIQTSFSTKDSNVVFIIRSQISLQHRRSIVVASHKTPTDGANFEQRSGIAVRNSDAYPTTQQVRRESAKDRRMKAVVFHIACTEIVRRLYRAYDAFARRLYRALRFRHSVSVARASCERRKSSAEAQRTQ